MISGNLKQSIFILLFAVLFVSAVSCNSKDTDDENEIVVTPSIVAVKNFYLQANDSVLAHLDSVAFSIDLKTGVIFNADSLPKGTDITRLVPSITFANTMTKAELSFLKDNEEEVVVDYLTNPGDSIDFSYPVTLDVTAADGLNSFSYQIRVNVHKMEPDTLIWDKIASSNLPSSFSNPVAQKTVVKNDVVYSLIEESNGEYTLSSSTELNEGIWVKEKISLPFAPDVKTFTSTPDNFFILSQAGDLYLSTDASSWIATNENWLNILGPYENSVLGIKRNGNEIFHSMYPASEDFQESVIEKDFPLYNSTILGVTETPWYPKPFALIACGITENGELSNAVWGFDGNKWAIINDSGLPSLAQPMMARYVVYRDTPYVFAKRELDVWLLFGGVNENNEMNRNVYMSYDNGVNWAQAPQLMQLPENIPLLEGADVIVFGYELEADLSEAWTPQSITKSYSGTRTSYTIDGYEIKWMCPYLYIFGGYDEDAKLSMEIWRGVLARLEFMPII